MKGFIELHKDRVNGGKKPISLCASHISGFEENAVYFGSGNYAMVSETYDEIKALIEEAQKEDGVSIQYVPYVPPQEPQIVPLPYFAPYRPDVYRTVPTRDTVTHPVGNAIGTESISTSTSMDAEGNVVAVELAKLVGEKNEREPNG